MASTKKSSSSSTKMKLKLLIDKTRNRVLFAEAGKDFVDFLFGLLQLPVGAILRLLPEHGTGTNWSIAKVYESVQSMDSNYMQPNQSKVSLLSPKCPPSNTKQTPMLEQFGCTDSSTEHLPAFPSTKSSDPFTSFLQQDQAKSFNRLGFEFGNRPKQRWYSDGNSFTGDQIPVKTLNISQSISSILLAEPTVVDGYVKEMATYMVMDDLTMKPMSTISSITILNTFKVRDVGCLEEKITEIDMEMALKLVKAVFESTTVLTDVFLRAEVIFLGMT